MLIALLSVNTSAFAQILVILKDARSIKVDSVRYENNQCVYTKNGIEKSVSLDLIEEIYVLNEGRIYPPQNSEPTEKQDIEIISDKKETQERDNTKKKSEDNTTNKETLEPVEKTYVFQLPQGSFQCKIPKSWNYNETFGVHSFSPYSLDKDFNKTRVEIIGSPHKVDVTTLSKEHKTQIMKGYERTGEKLLSERVRSIAGIEAWETFLDIQRGQATKRHQILLIHNGYIITVSLEAYSELYESADTRFERIVASLEFF